MRAFYFAVPFAAALIGLSTSGHTQTYPDRPVRLIVPFTAGGGTDLIARTLAQKLQDSLGQPFVVENRGGAGGNLGTDLAAKAPADGYTLLLGYSSNFSISPFLYSNLPYKPLADFAPISLVAIATNLMVAHPSVGVSDLKSLQALAKSRTKRFNYSSSGVGTVGHLTVELYKSVAGVDFIHVPYKGVSSAITDLLAGRVELYAGSPALLMPYVRSGTLTPLGVSSAQRDPGLADIPTFIEQGYPVEALAWFGLLAPAGTPKNIVQKLNAAVVAALQSSEVRETYANIGYTVQTNSVDVFTAFIQSDYDKWKKVIADAGIKVE
jgi:tripartite-type tricarboxylate transporter receptor subunit TctC